MPCFSVIGVSIVNKDRIHAHFVDKSVLENGDWSRVLVCIPFGGILNMKYSIFLIGEIFELWMYNNLWCSLHAGVKHSQHTLELMIWCMRKDFYHLNQVIGIGALPLTSSQRSIVYFVQRYPNPIVLFLHVIYACCAVPVHVCPQNKLLMPVNCCKVP